MIPLGTPVAASLTLMHEVWCQIAPHAGECSRAVIEIRIAGIPDAINETRRRHWSSSAAKTAKWRNDARLSALAAIQASGAAVPILYADVELTFVLDAARGDLDNLLASCKPYIDGIRDAGVFRDDSVSKMPRLSLGWIRGAERGVIIRVREATF